ncbi:hypothetical protein [Actinomadura sp. 9N215]|uniref:hypothetical protein n=1 Tax=Actinomadura sp. 9N215 TaxID=3375150 RepID=UPI0037B0D408
MIEPLDGVQYGLPAIRDGLRCQCGVMASDLRPDVLSSRHPFTDFCGEPLVLLGLGPVAVPWGINGRHGEAAIRYVAMGPCRHSWAFLC